MIMRLIAAMTCNTPFPLAWKRSCHIKNGHPFDDSVLVEKFTSEEHPHSDGELVYTVNLRKCNDCGLMFNDDGLEFRRP